VANAQTANIPKHFTIPACTAGYGVRSRLVHDTDGSLLILQSPEGGQTAFHDFDQWECLPGQFALHQTPGGVQTRVTDHSVDEQIARLERSLDNTVQTMSLEYFTDGPNVTRISQIALEQQIGSDPVTLIPRSRYKYYGSE